MAKDEEPTDITATVWGTWEELLLASAVNHHGFRDWDSVAMEVQARSSLPNLLATARNCELKFRDLRRRFGSEMRNGDAPVERENGTDIGDEIDGFPWIDELRKLRVAELKREVQRSDVSIHSLQLKVKRLEEERDRSLKKETSLGKPDLEKSREQRSENDNKSSEKSDRSEPARTAVKVAVSGGESERDYHSVNESNSTGSKTDDAKTGEETTQSESKPGLFCSDRSEPLQRDSKPVTADSDNGSSDTVAKKTACETLDNTSLEKKVNESSELDDSLARSNGGGEEGTRESSEVQSSASLAGKRKRKKRQRREIVVVGPIIGEEEAPPQPSPVVEQSEEMMRTIQAHHHSYLFESRLQSQESGEYKNVVRQHMDLDTIRAKLDKGSYASSSRALYRDFLLLFTNAVVFYPRSYSESIAGSELLHLVLGEMKKTPQPSQADTSLLIPAHSQVPKIERSDSLLAKQKSAVPIIVCRKRSSITVKTSSMASIGNKGEEHHNDEKKSSFDAKPPVETTSTVVEEPVFIKENKAKDKTITGARSQRRINDGTNIPAPSGKRQSTSSAPDKKKPETVPLDKRRSAADFLKRIKQNSPAENLNSRAASIDGGEQKKSGVKGEKGKERLSRQSKEKKPARDDNSPSKRSVGRPPKKVMDKTSVSTKRAREGGGKEPLKRPRKRSKR